MEQVKVLLIDTDEANREFLSRMLHKKNYEVVLASTGQEGVDKAGQEFPTLIIFDPNLPDLSPKELLTKFSQNKRTAHIPCVALSSHSDPEEMQICLQAGCAEYFVKSGMIMLNLVDSIPKIILENQRTSAKSKDGLVVVFLSAKGGTGTSSVCANIGMSIARNIQAAKVVLVDLVLPMGSIAHIVGCEDRDFNLITVSNHFQDEITEEYLGEYLNENCTQVSQWFFSLLPGSPDPATAGKLDVGKIPGMIAALRKKFDYVLVDVGRALSRISLPIIAEADLIALVLGTDLSTVTLTKKLWEFLREQQVTSDKIFAILNRAVGLEGLTKMEAEKILGLEIKFMIPYMMGNFALANNQHVPILTKFPMDTASMVLKQASLDMSRQALSVNNAN